MRYHTVTTTRLRADGWFVVGWFAWHWANLEGKHRT